MPLVARERGQTKTRIKDDGDNDGADGDGADYILQRAPKRVQMATSNPP